MADIYRVNITAEASAELSAIFDYVAQDSPRNAAKLIARLLDAIDALNIVPHRYRVVRNASTVGEDVRSMALRPYLIRYTVDDGRHLVTILSVRHGARASNL